MKNINSSFYSLRFQDNFEVSNNGRHSILPEGAGGETMPGPITVVFGETRFSKWPDSFRSGIVNAFSEQVALALQNAQITGIEWYSVEIGKTYNRRLMKSNPPRYLWARIVGRIRANPYFVEIVDSGRKNSDGTVIANELELSDPVLLDSTGCCVINNTSGRSVRHRILPDTWDGKDWVRVLPTAINPSEICSERLANLFAELKVENLKAFPLRKGYGL